MVDKALGRGVDYAALTKCSVPDPSSTINLADTLINDPSALRRRNLKTQLYFYDYAYCPHAEV